MPRLTAPMLFAVMSVLGSAAAFAQGAIPTGRYECYYFTTPLPGMAFTINGPGSYSDVEGKAGTYTVTGSQIAFSGAAFNGQHALFHPGSPPTIAFVGTGGRETEVCQPPK
jgi:hypothetical protein